VVKRSLQSSDAPPQPSQRRAPCIRIDFLPVSRNRRRGSTWQRGSLQGTAFWRTSCTSFLDHTQSGIPGPSRIL